MRLNDESIVIDGVEYFTIRFVSDAYGISPSSIRSIIYYANLRKTVAITGRTIGYLTGGARLLTHDDVTYILSRFGQKGKSIAREMGKMPAKVKKVKGPRGRPRTRPLQDLTVEKRSVGRPRLTEEQKLERKRLTSEARKAAREEKRAKTVE